MFTHSPDSVGRVCSIIICACVKVSTWCDFKCAGLNIPVRVVFSTICMSLLQSRDHVKIYD